ncbi:MAG: dTDP-glucose 4,6-dehydratase [candidate division BRC1 bacterium ADurb.BinA292]|nr:MAG: dTDP-glucose 4,6-dehydratase [candidate division BRC1 bacterium ADurb.BinA292]
MASYLITGGAGFIGSHLAEALLARGHHVWIIDDLSTGSIANLDPIRENPRLQYFVDTIMNTARMAELIDRVDGVFHLAAAVGVRLIFENPVHTIQTNIRGTEIVLELAARKKKKVQIASTSEVYGKGARVPFRESEDLVLGPTTCPRWSYACSKLIDEFLALAYWREKQMPTLVTRFFNTVGPRQTGRYGMVIPNFVGQALRGEALTVHGDGRQTRSFAHVRDVVRAVIELMERDDTNGEVFNIGNPQEVSIIDLARRILELTGSHSEIRHVPYEEVYGPDFEDLDRRVPDVTKLAGTIDWSALQDLDAILRAVIETERGKL